MCVRTIKPDYPQAGALVCGFGCTSALMNITCFLVGPWGLLVVINTEMLSSTGHALGCLVGCIKSVLQVFVLCFKMEDYLWYAHWLTNCEWQVTVIVSQSDASLVVTSGYLKPKWEQSKHSLQASRIGNRTPPFSKIYHTPKSHQTSGWCHGTFLHCHSCVSEIYIKEVLLCHSWLPNSVLSLKNFPQDCSQIFWLHVYAERQSGLHI